MYSIGNFNHEMKSIYQDEGSLRDEVIGLLRNHDTGIEPRSKSEICPSVSYEQRFLVNGSGNFYPCQLRRITTDCRLRK